MLPEVSPLGLYSSKNRMAAGAQMPSVTAKQPPRAACVQTGKPWPTACLRQIVWNRLYPLIHQVECVRAECVLQMAVTYFFYMSCENNSVQHF